MPGTAYVLFHHVMGETNGKRGVWAYVRGGMGGLTQALARAATDLGVDIRLNSEVAQIITKDDAVSGVVLADGQEFFSRTVASSADCNVTFNRLLADAQDRFPPRFCTQSTASATRAHRQKINVALEHLPSFTALPGHEAGPQHRGTVHLCPDQEYIERGYDDAKYGGRPPIPSSSAPCPRPWIPPLRRRENI